MAGWAVMDTLGFTGAVEGRFLCICCYSLLRPMGGPTPWRVGMVQGPLSFSLLKGSLPQRTYPSTLPMESMSKIKLTTPLSPVSPTDFPDLLMT